MLQASTHRDDADRAARPFRDRSDRPLGRRDVSLATAANTCCSTHGQGGDHSLRAELTSFGGTYFATPALPCLWSRNRRRREPACLQHPAVQPGTAAQVLPLTGGAEPREPVSHGRAPLETVKEVTTGFLNGYLRHSASSLAALESQGSVPGLATISSAPAVGPKAAAARRAGLEGHRRALDARHDRGLGDNRHALDLCKPAASNSATHASGVMGRSWIRRRKRKAFLAIRQ